MLHGVIAGRGGSCGAGSSDRGGSCSGDRGNDDDDCTSLVHFHIKPN